MRRVLLAVALIVLASCGVRHPARVSAPSTTLEVRATTTSIAPPGPPTGWEAQVNSTEVIFLTFVRDHDTVTGSIQVADETFASGTTTVNGKSLAFTGSLQGTTLSLSVEAMAPWSGVLKGSRLTLNVPQADGTLLPVVLHPASVSAYNDAVAELKANAETANQAAAAAATRAANQQAYNKAAAGLSRAIDDINSAGADADRVNFQSTLSAYARDWATMQADFNKLQGAECGDVSYDASTVSYDLSSIGYDDSSLSYDDTGASSASRAIDAAIEAGRQALGAAQSAAAAAGSPAVIADGLQAAITGAQTKQASLTSRSAAAHSAAMSYDNEAKALNDQAQTFAGSHSC